MIVARPSAEKIRTILNKAAEKSTLKLKEVGFPTDFLGLQLEIIKGKTASLKLTKYTENAIKIFNPNNEIPLYDTLIEVGIKLVKNEKQASLYEIKTY